MMQSCSGVGLEKPRACNVKTFSSFCSTEDKTKGPIIGMNVFILCHNEPVVSTPLACCASLMIFDCHINWGTT
ncbi:hypothetical protein SDC49_01505 [Lactobacillus sp. R2/2]|nr:hypothetical protein [Lactobacillus sp. R2/2]